MIPVHARRAAAPEPHFARLLAALIALACSAAGWAASGGRDVGFVVREVETRLVDDVYRANARIDFAFSQQALEAMDNGVPITVVVEMQVMRQRVLIDKRVSRAIARFRIKTHALTERYVVTDLVAGSARTFRSFDEMIEGLGRISDVPLLTRDALRDDTRHRLLIRARLDVEALPAPLRPLAYLNRLWGLTSDWTQWPLDP